MKEVVMPALGMAQETGILLQWLKTEGEEVAKGEPLMEIETDKAAVEVEAPASGVLANITAWPGDEIPVGQVIARILTLVEAVAQKGEEGEKRRGEAEAVSLPPRLLTSSPVAARIAAEYNVDLSQINPDSNRIQKADVLAYLNQKDEGGGMKAESHPSRLPASPKARRLAAEYGLNLAAIAGSGPDGAVLAADVAEAQKQRSEEAKKRRDGETGLKEVPTFQRSNVPTFEPAATLQTLTMSKLWRIAADRLTQSWTTVPHFYLIREVNATQLIAWRERASGRATEKISYTDLLVKITAVALRQHPRLNAMWHEGSIVLNNEVNIGLAVAVEEGLIVPVIHQADRLGLNELAARRQELVAKAQANKLSLAEISGGTFTLSNLGMYGVDAFNAIVNPPQAAILAVGRMADRVVPVNGQPAVQPMLTLSLSGDHRVVDGARGAQFLQTLADLVAEPLRLLD
jgi:pyruvate dehydrogenase E2 component (dihydrolipoamide acetyltransferase)